MIKTILNLFKPNDFENYFYGWLTNQMSHTAFSCGVVAMVMLCGFDTTYFSIAFTVFWIIWETRHLIISKNIVDCAQDLFFEISGIVIILYPYYLFFVVFIFVSSILNYAYKEWKKK